MEKRKCVIKYKTEEYTWYIYLSIDRPNNLCNSSADLRKKFWWISEVSWVLLYYLILKREYAVTYGVFFILNFWKRNVKEKLFFPSFFEWHLIFKEDKLRSCSSKIFDLVENYLVPCSVYVNSKVDRSENNCLKRFDL